MIGRDGTYLVHPDTAKLFRETIFSDAAPEARRAHDLDQTAHSAAEPSAGCVT